MTQLRQSSPAFLTVFHLVGGSVFKLHDFGFRGVSSVESAAIGGAGHLVNFLGTDTVAALLCTKKYYNAKKAAGHSIPASEHSTITSWGVDHEVDAMKNMLLQYPSGLVACVSDSFDVFKACREYWGDQLKDLIKGRISGDSFGRLVVRPDSGDPTETCVKIVTILCEQFKDDVSTTKTGHKLLPPYIRVIQGDGVDYESVPKILGALKDAGGGCRCFTYAVLFHSECFSDGYCSNSQMIMEPGPLARFCCGQHGLWQRRGLVAEAESRHLQMCFQMLRNHSEGSSP